MTAPSPGFDFRTVKRQKPYDILLKERSLRSGYKAACDAGRISKSMSLEQYTLFQDRLSNPRSSVVERPRDFMDDKILRREKARVQGMYTRKDPHAVDASLSLDARILRWDAEKDAYGRRLFEAERMNDICDDALRILSDKTLPSDERRTAYNNIYEIATTGHLRGVSEALLGNQEATIRNYDYHVEQDVLAGKPVYASLDLDTLRKFENRRTAAEERERFRSRDAYDGSSGVPDCGNRGRAQEKAKPYRHDVSGLDIGVKPAEPSSSAGFDFMG